MLPSVLKAFSLFVDGTNYAGKADVKPPDLGLVTEDYAAGGMSARVKLDMGLVEALDASFTLYDYEPAVLSQFGLINGNAVSVVFRGGKAADDGTVTAIKVSCRGQLQMANMGNWEAGSKTALECTLNCRSYKLEIGGETIIDIDAELMTRFIGGIDQMAALRGAIGF